MLTDLNSSGKKDKFSGEASFFVIDTAKECKFARFLSLACTIGRFNSAFILLDENRLGFFVKPASEYSEIKNLSPLYLATLVEGKFLEIVDLNQQEFHDISFSGKSLRSFTGVVLKDQEGKNAGVLCLLGDSP